MIFNFELNEAEDEYLYDKEFQIAKTKIVGKRHDDKGIGTLSEKTVHAVLKNFIEPDEDNHEVALDGYFADIYSDGEIVEIQTRSFNRLRDKLNVFLNNYTVTVVYPMPYNKWVSWIDEKTGETSPKRKSPRHFTEYDAFFELYKIKNYLNNPNLKIKLFLMDMDEYKLLNGWNYSKKRGATRYDRIPLGVRKIVSIDQAEDYIQFIPFEIPEEFTSADFAKSAKINKKTAGQVLNILYFTGAVERIGKKGNSYLYRASIQ